MINVRAGKLLETTLVPEGSLKDVALSVVGISKRYGGIVALDNMSFDVRHGEVLGQVGDNGAGNSTLLR
jgi:ABC-type sugar transport system ATPase subunit